jgi:hypothetical protein
MPRSEGEKPRKSMHEQTAHLNEETIYQEKIRAEQQRGARWNAAPRPASSTNENDEYYTGETEIAHFPRGGVGGSGRVANEQEGSRKKRVVQELLRIEQKRRNKQPLTPGEIYYERRHGRNMLPNLFGVYRDDEEQQPSQPSRRSSGYLHSYPSQEETYDDEAEGYDEEYLPEAKDYEEDEESTSVVSRVMHSIGENLKEKALNALKSLLPGKGNEEEYEDEDE